MYAGYLPESIKDRVEDITSDENHIWIRAGKCVFAFSHVRNDYQRFVLLLFTGALQEKVLESVLKHDERCYFHTVLDGGSVVVTAERITVHRSRVRRFDVQSHQVREFVVEGEVVHADGGLVCTVELNTLRCYSVAVRVYCWCFVDGC